MIIYLDQNKWIELARMLYGKDSSSRGKEIVSAFRAAIDSNAATVPLSSIHYMELARISNSGRRARLGKSLWHISRGRTILPYTVIIRDELSTSLSKHFSAVTPISHKLIGWGSYHAFGMEPPQDYSSAINHEIESALLAGSKKLNIDPLSFRNSTHQQNFKCHLETLYERSLNLPKEQIEDWLYATLMMDMLNPLNEVLKNFGIKKSEIESMAVNQLKSIIDNMPTRSLDLHLHRQVLTNPNYVAKITDLEDWAGLCVAACYCDVVVCEKHMADMMKRGRYVTHARIETNLADTFKLII